MNLISPKPLVGIGFRAIRGGSVTIAVAIDKKKEPRIVQSLFLATAVKDDRLSLEPYHVASAMARGPDGNASIEARALVAEGRNRQDVLASANLEETLTRLHDGGYEPVVAALLINRSGWISDLLDYSLSYPDHPPIAEGLAVRNALRFACNQCNIDIAELDEKSLPEHASKLLNLEPAQINIHLNELGKSAGKPWRREQKIACLAAWVSLIEHIDASVA